MLKRHWPLLIGLCGMYLPLIADSKAVTEDEFIRSAVIPLPERPPTDLVELIAILKPYQYANLRPYEYRRCSLATTQVALWLGRLGISDLQAIRNSIPSMWSAGWRGYAAHDIGLGDILDDLIGEKQADSSVMDQPFAALAAGYRSAKADWKSAIASSSNIGDAEIRSKFLYGVALSAARAESLRAAEEIRSAIGELPSSYDRQKLSNYGHHWDQWVSLWPAESISAEASALPNRGKFAEAVFENEAHFFASPERQARFLESLGSHGSRIFSPSVHAARDPNGFLDWWEPQEDDLKNSTIEKAIVPLLRRDPTVIGRVIKSLPGKSDRTDTKVFEAWSRHDSAAAVEWAINRPILQKRETDLNLSPYTKTDPKRVIDLCNRHPEISKISFRYGTLGGLVADCFDPLRDRPDNFASAILTLSDPVIRKTALRSFGARWGYDDGRSAFAFGERIVEDSDREQWLVAILENWIEKAPDKAAAALNETIEVSGMDR